MFLSQKPKPCVSSLPLQSARGIFHPRSLGLQRGAARPRAGGGKGEGDGEVAADGGAERARGAGDLHTRTTCRRRWGSVCFLAVVGARHPRPPARHIGRPNADILHHGPPPAYAHGREAVRLAEAWPQVHPVSCAGHARPAGRPVCERLSAGWRVPAEPTMLRLNSHFLGF